MGGLSRRPSNKFRGATAKQPKRARIADKRLKRKRLGDYQTQPIERGIATETTPRRLNLGKFRKFRT